jgi:hypothetical protein
MIASFLLPVLEKRHLLAQSVEDFRLRCDF